MRAEYKYNNLLSEKLKAENDIKNLSESSRTKLNHVIDNYKTIIDNLL